MPSPTTMQRPNLFWDSSYRFFTLLALLIGALYLGVMWSFTSNTPYGDGYIQAFFTVIHWQEGTSLLEKISNTWWTYFQHRAVFTKTITLLMYTLFGSLDLHIEGLLSNAMLVLLIGCIAYSCYQHKIPAYSIAISALLILTVYPWSVSTWPECALFYFSTIVFSFLSLVLLDLPRPKIVAASFFCWLAAFTMANGLLTIIIGSIVIGFNHIIHRRYTRTQLILWFVSAAGCLIVHLATMNVFSTDLFGAKTVQESFINVGGRFIDFLASLGAAPFPPKEYRLEKIVLGTFTLVISCALLLSKKSRKSPAIVGLLLFSTGTIFITSLFRYSAGDNDGYQIFTTTNYAAILLLASIHIRSSRWQIPCVLLLTAVLFNLNALWMNTSKITNKQNKLVEELQFFLVTGKSNTKHWLDVILREALEKNIYRPLQSHSLLPIAQEIQAISKCDTAVSIQGILETQTGEKSFALLATIQLPERNIDTPPQVLLCNDQQSYRITLSEKNLSQKNQDSSLKLLLDKRAIDAGEYRIQIHTKAAQFSLPTPITIKPVAPWDRADKDCKTMQFVARWPAFKPLIDHYCKPIKQPT